MPSQKPRKTKTHEPKCHPRNRESRGRMSATATPNPTREVFNQPPPLRGYNMYLENRPLTEAARREGADWAEEKLVRLGGGGGGEGGGAGGGGGGGAARVGPARQREPAAAEDP